MEKKVKRILEIITSKYNINYSQITNLIDSTNKDDFRLNIILDNKYVVRINNSNVMNEERLSEIDRLITRYNSIGVYSPHYIKNNDNLFSIIIDNLICYVSYYADYPLASELELDQNRLLEETVYHLGILSSKYTNYDLVDTKSMWSIIDLAPLDDLIDEKEENLNILVDELNTIGEYDIATQVVEFNKTNRKQILKVFKDLPRCVYQGDLNDTNLLIKDNHFYGLIDFNLSGTEVNINCFLAETNKNLEEEDLKKYDSHEIFDLMINYQNRYLKKIFENYLLNKIELQVFENYRNIILISQYPNVCAYIYGIRNGYKEKILKLIKLIINR